MIGADRPAGHLVRHFLSGLFDFGILSETEAASFKRVMLGIATVFLSLGLLLARVYRARYRELAEAATGEAYARAVLGDHALLIAIPMWTVAVVTVLIGHALFPDETDYRVLMALPVTRRLIFLAKLAAVALFAGAFALAMHVALLPLALLTCLNPWAEHVFLARLAAYEAVSFTASALAVLFVVAAHGVLLVLLPRARALTGSAVMRSLLLCALVLALFFVVRLPAAGRAISAGASWIHFVPPVWFVGAEEWLLGAGAPHVGRLARGALWALALCAGVSALTYALVYRQFDRVMLRAGEPHASPDWRRGASRALRLVRRPSFRAVQTFIVLTLRRSVLHQGILVVLGAIGVGFTINSLIAADVVGWWQRAGRPSRGLTAIVIWAPFAFLLAAAVAVRMTLVVPVEQRANWLFRMTEDASARADQLEAAAWALRRFAVALPIALLVPVQWLVLGAGAVVPVVIVEALLGCFVVEILMRNWVVIPFTSSYLPGKGFLPQTLLRAAIVFVVFTTFGSTVAHLTRLGTGAGVVIDVVLVAIVAWMRRRRRLTARERPLSFEDLPPNEVQTLGLFSD